MEATIDKLMKNIKQYSKPLSKEDMQELQTIARYYATVKNYVYSRFSGINSLLLLNKARKKIRDAWVKSGFAKQWNLQARYWKMALEEAIGNIKTEWANIKIRIKKVIKQNKNLNEDEKKFISYVLKNDKLLHQILRHQDISSAEILKKLSIREKYTYNLIRRYVRRYKGKVPYSKKKRTFSLDSSMYDYYKVFNTSSIEIMGLTRGKRIKVALRENNIHKGNLRIVLKDDYLEIHRSKLVKATPLHGTIIDGINKGYRILIANSEGQHYGENLNDMLSKETERLKDVNAKRNQFYALNKKYLEEGKTRKADNILKNNLGKIKYNKLKNKHDCRVKSYINQELSRYFKEVKPKEVVAEDLSYVSWNDKFPKHVKRKLSRWIKGYIQKRLDYKAKQFGVKLSIVNSAYTSQICHKCGNFGKRNQDNFTCDCGSFHADTNAAINILNRKYDKEISLYTPYKIVKQILENRLKQNLAVS